MVVSLRQFSNHSEEKTGGQSKTKNLLTVTLSVPETKNLIIHRTEL